MSEERHFLDLPLGRISLLLRFLENEIVCSVDIPKGKLFRRHKRALNKWIRSITHPLNADPRPMRMVALHGGSLVSMGFESKGVVCFIREGKRGK